MLEKIKIVLVETSHTGNIGSAARAMKTMGLQHLCLVAPKQLPDEQALALSAGATDVVEQAEIVSSFEEAIADCTLVIGTSARSRHLKITPIQPRACGEKTIQHLDMLNHLSQDAENSVDKVAIVFGRERVGLTNPELLKCHYHLNIPANPDYSSLNLAMAVQLVCYEIRMAWLNHNAPLNTIDSDDSAINIFYPKQEQACVVTDSLSLPSQQQLEYFFRQTEQVYTDLGFIQNAGVMQKLRRLYLRVGLKKNELNILQGMLSAVQTRFFNKS